MATKINEEILKEIKIQRKKIKESIFSNQTKDLGKMERELELLLREVRRERRQSLNKDIYAMKDLRVVK